MGEIAGQEEGRRLLLAVLSESDDASGTAQAAAFLGGVVKVRHRGQRDSTASHTLPRTP